MRGRIPSEHFPYVLPTIIYTIRFHLQANSER